MRCAIAAHDYDVRGDTRIGVRINVGVAACGARQAAAPSSGRVETKVRNKNGTARRRFLPTLVVSLLVAFVGGLAARAVRLSPVFGHLLAGIVLGPFTPAA